MQIGNDLSLSMIKSSVILDITLWIKYLTTTYLYTTAGYLTRFWSSWFFEWISQSDVLNGPNIIQFTENIYKLHPVHFYNIRIKKILVFLLEYRVERWWKPQDLRVWNLRMWYKITYVFVYQSAGNQMPDTIEPFNYSQCQIVNILSSFCHRYVLPYQRKRKVLNSFFSLLISGTFIW